jgi:hypothetical protein
MDRREFVLDLLGKAENPTLDDKVVFEVIYRRPYTHVKIHDMRGNKPVYGYGFSKVCYPDKWDKEVGRSIALAKAARDLAEVADAP